MKGYIINIEKNAEENVDYRRVLYTAPHSQLVLMNIQPGDEIGEETHKLDQFIRFETGQGKVVLDGIEHEVEDGYAVVIPAGTKHNIRNTSSDKDLKLYTLYSPPNHKDGIVHITKADAVTDESEHFDGTTTE